MTYPGLNIDYVKNYELWRALLGGRKGGGKDGEVHLGFWRYRTKNHENGGDPVAIWEDGGNVICQIGSRVVDDHLNVFNAGIGKDKYTLADLFNWVRTRPISEEVYWARMDSGNWPDLHETVTAQAEENRERIGGNNPPSDDPFDRLKDQIDQLSGEVNGLLKSGAAKTEDEANKAGDLANALGKLWTQAEKQRQIEKAPHWQKCQEIQAKWDPVLDLAAVYKKVKAVVITPWQLKAEAERQEKLRAERAEAERIKREAEEAQRKADEEAQRLADKAAQGQVDEQTAKAAISEAAAQADLLKQQAAEAEKKADETAKNTVKVGQSRGKAISLKSFLVIEVTNRREAAAAFKDNGDFLRDLDLLIEKYARPLIQNGKQVPGVESRTEQRAA